MNWAAKADGVLPLQARAGLEEFVAGRGGFSADATYTGDKPWLVSSPMASAPSLAAGSEAVTVIRRGGADEGDLQTTIGARV